MKRGIKTFAVFSAVLMMMSTIVCLAVAQESQASHFSSPHIEWKSIIFGQSVTKADNSVVVGQEGDIVISSLNGKGKVTGSHDGIAFYYFELDPAAFNFFLSADIEVLTYANDNDPAKPKPNNQEAFGIMARDAIGVDGDSAVFASNMVYVGGYRGQLQAVMRENVEEKSGYGAKMNAEVLSSAFPSKGTRFRLSLRKTNSGYTCAIEGPQGKETTFYRPGLLQVQDKTRLYAGFFAARNASIKVSDIDLSFSDPRTDPPAIAEPPKPIVPALSVLSPTETGNTIYRLILTANTEGSLSIFRKGELLAADIPLAASKEFVQELWLAHGENTIDLVFSPWSKEGQAISSAPLKRQLKITLRPIDAPDGIIRVTSSGKPSGDGTEANPLDLQTAVSFARPGQTILLKEGTYRFASALIIARGNDGKEGNPIRLSGPGADKAILSFEESAPGVQLLADWWILSGFSVTRSTSTGIRIAGNHNVVEGCTAIKNLNTGIQVSGSSMDPAARWPSYNLIRACVARGNRDLAESDADGFAAKLTVGPGNIFVNCVAMYNCDDGWDLYTKLETGAIAPVRVERCVAMANGFMPDGSPTKGDGNGFKLGGEGIAVAHEIEDCKAFSNRSAGFTVNSNPSVAIKHSIAADNGGPNFVFALYGGATPAFRLALLLSLRSSPGPADIYGDGVAAEDLFFYNGTVTRNASGKTLAPGLFDVTNRPSEVLPGEDSPVLGSYLTLKP